MASRVKVQSSAKAIVYSTSGGYFSGTQLAKNVRSFISAIKKG